MAAAIDRCDRHLPRDDVNGTVLTRTIHGTWWIRIIFPLKPSRWLFGHACATPFAFELLRDDLLGLWVAVDGFEKGR